MKSFITEICTTIGPRPPCSPQERACGQVLKQKLQDLCDEVTLERFVTHPHAYKAGFRLPMILYLLALFFYWGVPWASLILAGASFFIFFGEMALVYEMIDKAFPAQESVNVVSKIKPAGDRKHLLIIGGHLDANYEFPLMRKLGVYFSLIITVNTMLGGVLFLFLVIKNLLLLAGAATSLVGIESILFWIFCGGIPFALLQLFYIISNRPVMGANDNLSAVAVCHELAKALGKAGQRPQSVEVWIMAFGCEETGSMGSKAFVKAHLPELQGAKALIIDMIGNKGSPLEIDSSEVFGTVRMDPEFSLLVQDAAQQAGLTLAAKPSMAFTDALSFRRKKIPAVALISMPHGSKDFFYHTRDDTIENMGFENLVSAYKICLNLVAKLDNK